MEQIRLTEFSPGAGCGCKISPRDLELILKSEHKAYFDKNLLVGNETKDDAAVYDIGNGQCIISTTDFFTPIVDDAYDFGRIAATNAISDIYAMGGKPIMAIAILGWPLEKLSTDVASRVIEGAREVCTNAKIILAGGHSIDIHDPIFGLAVTGIVEKSNIKQNSTAEEDCILFLTKPIGIGILSTAEKRSVLKANHSKIIVDLMTRLNSVGEHFAKLNCVKAMTDVTGFGLLGHLLEMCEGSNLNAIINYNKIPLIEGIKEYIELKAIPGGTYRNWKSYGHKIQLTDESQKFILCDPQTSGGLLVAVKESDSPAFLEIAKQQNCKVFEIGKLISRKESEYFIEVV